MFLFHSFFFIACYSRETSKDQSYDWSSLSSLSVLCILCPFNLPLNNINLPPSLSSLFVPNSFNQPIDDLPSSLTLLTLGTHFNHPIDYLPPHLQFLYLGDYFDHQLIISLLFVLYILEDSDNLLTTCPHN